MACAIIKEANTFDSFACLWACGTIHDREIGLTKITNIEYDPNAKCKDKERGTYYFVTRVKLNNGETKQVKRRGFKTKKEAKLAEAQLLLEPQEQASAPFEDISLKYLDW